MSNGKGSGRRPRQVPREEYEANWDAVFNKDGKVQLTPELFRKLQKELDEPASGDRGTKRDPE